MSVHALAPATPPLYYATQEGIEYISTVMLDFFTSRECIVPIGRIRHTLNGNWRTTVYVEHPCMPAQSRDMQNTRMGYNFHKKSFFA